MAEPVPLTPGQERIWLSEQRYPGSALNHLVGCYRLDGAVDPDLLAEALRLATVRHQALRLAFEDSDGGPVAFLHPDARQVLEVVQAEGFDRAYAGAVAAAGRPFALTQPGLLRAVLCRFGPDQHLLTLVIHHLVADGTAASVLAGDVAEAYRACRSGVWSPPAPAISYLDHVAQEAARAGGEAERAGLDYWRRELAGAPPMVDLATDLVRPSHRSYRTHHHAEVLPGDLLPALRRFARDRRASPTLVLAAAWAATLGRLAGQDDLVFGMAVSRRDRPETAGLVASLMNVLPLRVHPILDATLVDVVGRVRTALLRGMAHQDVPLQRIVDHVRPERVAGLAPLVHVLFNQDAAGSGLALDGVRVVPVELDTPAGMDLDVELSVVSRAPGHDVRLLVRCAADLFRQAATGGMLEQFVALLRDGLARPEAAVGELDLIGPAGRAVIQRHATGPAPAAGGRASAPAAIEQRMRSQPSAPAVVAGERTLTYGELGRWSAVIADRLAGAGVGRGDIVALYAHRSVELLAGMLAAWRRRAAYLPVDPNYPDRRVAFLLHDSAAAAILTTAQLRDRLPAELNVPVVALDDVTGPGPAGPHDPAGPYDPAGPHEPGDLAYVIYTSGSTGVPKGVRITHRGLGNLLDAVAREVGIGPDTVMLAVTSPSFDIAAVELFGPLWAGGRIVLATPGDEVDPPRLAEVIGQHGVTAVQATPVTWKELVEVLPAGRRLDQAICAGEPLSQHLAGRICRVAGAVWNGYGPSETTIYSLWHRVDPGAEDLMTPIGRPVPGTTAYVVDERLRQRPPGVPGELLLGGAGVAQGYHRRPELTAERFVENPFGPGRVYRTGDVVRLRHDGVFEFRGRRDNQVKLRGHRVELDEIAEVLRRHPEVADAVVTVRRDRHGEPHLVAYVVGAGDPTAAQGGGSR
jgi:amino acid adenylation domain-containing protein